MTCVPIALDPEPEGAWFGDWKLWNRSESRTLGMFIQRSLWKGHEQDLATKRSRSASSQRPHHHQRQGIDEGGGRRSLAGSAGTLRGAGIQAGGRTIHRRTSAGSRNSLWVAWEPSAAKPEIDQSRAEFDAFARHFETLANALAAESKTTAEGIPKVSECNRASRWWQSPRQESRLCRECRPPNCLSNMSFA